MLNESYIALANLDKIQPIYEDLNNIIFGIQRAPAYNCNCV